MQVPQARTDPPAAAASAPSGAVAALSLGATAAASVGLWALVYRNVLAAPGTLVPAGQFHPSFVWGLHHVGEMLRGDRPWSVWTDRLGHPGQVHAELVAWAPSLLVAPVEGVIGPIGALNLALLLTVVASALAATWGLRCLTGVAWPAAAALGTALPWVPVVIGFQTEGQIEKAQLWCVILPLVFLHGALTRTGRGAVAAAAGGAVAIAASSFTSPSLTLMLPFAMLGVGLATLLDREHRLRALIRALPLGLLLLGALLPAHRYYQGVADLGASAFNPARNGAPRGSEGTSTAGPDDLLLPPQVLDEFHHLPYLGIAWVLAAVGLGLVLPAVLRRRRPPGRGVWVGLFVAAAGVVVAMGTTLTWRDQPIVVGGAPLALPMAWVEAFGYPLARSGQYYRAATIASLGLAILVAAGLSRLRPSRATVLAVAIGVLGAGESLWVTRAWWPVEARPPAARSLLTALAEDPVPGAVLLLPIEIEAGSASWMVAGAALHDRPVNTRVRRMDRREVPGLVELHQQVGAALATGPQAAPDTLAAAGFRAVMHYPEPPRPDATTRQALTAALGPPIEEDGVALWWLPPLPADPGTER